jgi:multisubunit Na+/H+ antiporter MnhG subunit
MFFGILTLLTALSMATVAAVFAIYGIIAIFAGMPQFALIMGAVIELGKIVGISWLYRNWNEPTKIKYFMAPLVLVAIMLTSMGIFGLLSKAHLEQTSPVANNEIQITRLDQQITREQSRIIDAEQVISQLDQSVQALIEFDRIRGPDGAIAVRESQADQREVLRLTIDTAQTEVDKLEDQKLELTQELTAIALEVGPVKYLAELVYGTETDRTEEAVRWVIIAFIFVFDPMAILLLMAANYTLDQRKKQPLVPEIPKQEPIVEGKEETDVKENTEELNNDTDTTDDTDTPDSDISDSAAQPDSQPESEPIGGEPSEGSENLQETVVGTDERDIVFVQPEGPIDINTSVSVEPVSITQPSAVDDAAQVIAESAALQKKPQDKQITTEGVTLVIDVGDGYVEYNKQLFQKDALKELRPDLFSIKPDELYMPSSSFGTQFPKIAKKKDIFVRVDVTPNKVYRFEGSKWIEISKNLSSTYLYDQEYIKYLINKIDQGEYDIDLLSEQEKIQIEEYLSNQNS